ncbi:aromatic ring-hydroxylating oxygenase subunit alpha [Parahaliea aestuarii]|uniref:Aromatic ring-hydroxylating dioxygenase subunit alpha n=1 Tax=Parahaliea aestuarii TaxID=1852021 RepID=A0A5C9A4R7_9GAMM|nr:aromatic ring-hydroxylating dioxygenase subunit alpha [Parahaliea aestuarii]TXS94720.1 aromatic ring-hydroxylating dioxygenase subunit alpha [Parahaliea aestuarii]
MPQPETVIARDDSASPDQLLARLQQRAAAGCAAPPPCSLRVPTSVYTEPARFSRERDALILRLPQVIGHESQLPKPGDTLTYDWLGLPLITTRDKNGDIGTFMNVCRHRGMRLVQDEGVSSLRSLVCPYHQWTYGLDGALRNIPRAESFCDIDPADFNLVALPTEVRHGLIWVQATPGATMDLDAHLAGLGRDFDEFRLGDYHFCRQSVKDIACNWKLVQDAFLDGYHVVRLHKKTVGPFFPDALAESSIHGRHIRSAVARNTLLDDLDLAPQALDRRQHATFSYTLFPNMVLIFHPEYTSVISLFPQAADRTLFVHSMLTPRKPVSEQERDHFERSFELIDRGVFEAEDIFVSVGAQKGFASGANDSLLFGALEEPAVQFHRFVEEAL